MAERKILRKEFFCIFVRKYRTMPYYYYLKNTSEKLNETEQERTIEKLIKLRNQLNGEIPQKTATETLLLATWNIREFGDKRSWESLYYIAEIINRFDLVAVQEVASDLKGFEKLMFLLGPNWDFIVTDSTEGSAGGWERLAFVYDKCKIRFRKMAGEIVLPLNKLIDDRLQLARTPYCVSFQAGWFKFVLTTVHILFGEDTKKGREKRSKEIDAITSILSNRAKKEDMSYILLGDFNIPNVKDPMMTYLEKYGFKVPDAIKDHPTDLGGTYHYDQIAFKLKLDDSMIVFEETGTEKKAGAFDFTRSVYGEKDVESYKEYFIDKVEGKNDDEIKKYYMKSWRTFQMSDHLPLWVELKVDFSDQYLKKKKK